MKSAYQVLTTYTGDFEEMLTKMMLFDIFKPIIEAFEPVTAKKLIRYIAFLYSKDSNLILAKEDLKRKKIRCAKQADLPDELYANAVFLVPNNEMDAVPAIIRTVAIKYLDYQDEPNNKDLKSLEDLYDEMVEKSAMQPQSASDYDLKFKCREYANKIRQWIDDLRHKMKEEDTQVRAMRQELKEKAHRNTMVVRPENAAGIYNAES